MGTVLFSIYGSVGRAQDWTTTCVHRRVDIAKMCAHFTRTLRKLATFPQKISHTNPLIEFSFLTRQLIISSHRLVILQLTSLFIRWANSRSPSTFSRCATTATVRRCRTTPALGPLPLACHLRWRKGGAQCFKDTHDFDERVHCKWLGHFCMCLVQGGQTEFVWHGCTMYYFWPTGPASGSNAARRKCSMKSSGTWSCV